jgi:hypothetical protein
LVLVIVGLAAVYVDRCGCDVPRMSVASLKLLQQPTEGGSLWMAVWGLFGRTYFGSG